MNIFCIVISILNKCIVKNYENYLVLIRFTFSDFSAKVFNKKFYFCWKFIQYIHTPFVSKICHSFILIFSIF